MKIYTGGGDRGETSLFSGERAPKDAPRIEAYGTLDELNSVIGALAAALPPPVRDLEPVLLRIQGDLFRIGSLLATTPGSPAREKLAALPEERIRELERTIDGLQKELPELESFILPGGSPAAAWAHLARTVCRRAERRAVTLLRSEAAGEGEQELRRSLVYMNRLSDLLFVVARVCNHRLGQGDRLRPE
jgi:cob(I)alamin adenosyltransferase